MANNLEERLNALKGKQDNVGDQFGSDDIRTLVEGIEYAMSHGGTVGVTVTALEDGSGYKITITDSEGVAHEATLKNGADAYEVYKSTVPEGQSPMTKEEWLETLKGADGADGQDGKPGHNPCLGRFTSVPNPMPNGQIGDYLYVDTTTTDPNTQETTTTTTVYHYGSNGWDGGAVIDADHPTLASGQSVTAVHIKDENGDDDPNAQGVLSADAGLALAKGLDKISYDKIDMRISFDKNGYYIKSADGNLGYGGTSYKATNNYYEVHAGDIVKASFYATGNECIAFYDTSKVFKTPYQHNSRTGAISYITITVEEDGYFRFANNFGYCPSPDFYIENQSTNLDKLSKDVVNLSGTLDGVSGVLKNISVQFQINSVSQGLLKASDGSVGQTGGANYRYTPEYFYIYGREKILATAYATSNFAGVCFYGKDKELVGISQQTRITDAALEYNVPSNAYFARICTEYYDTTGLYIAVVGTEEQFPRKKSFSTDLNSWVAEEQASSYNPKTQVIEQVYRGNVSPTKRYMAIGFDDFRNTDFNVIAPLFEKYGGRAEFNRVHRQDVSAKDVNKLYQLVYGRHEIGDHTFYHYKFPFDEPRFNGYDPDNPDGSNQIPFPSNAQMRDDRGDGKNVFGITLTTPVSTTINYQGPEINTPWGSLSDVECQKIRRWFSVMHDTNTNIINVLDDLSNKYLGTTGSSKNSWDATEGCYTGGIFTGCKTSENHEIWERYLLVVEHYMKDKFGLNYKMHTWSLPGSKTSGCYFESGGKKYYDEECTIYVNNLAPFTSTRLKNQDGTYKKRSWTDVLREYGYELTHDATYPSRIDGQTTPQMRIQLIINANQSRPDALIYPSPEGVLTDAIVEAYPASFFTGSEPYEVQMYDGSGYFRTTLEKIRKDSARGIICGAMRDSTGTFSEKMFLEALLKYGKKVGLEFITKAEAYDICFNHQLKQGNLIYNPKLRNTAKEFLPTAQTVPSNPDGYEGNCQVLYDNYIPILETLGTGNTTYEHYGIPYGKIKYVAEVKGSGSITFNIIQNNSINTYTVLHTETISSANDFSEISIPLLIPDYPLTNGYDGICGGYGNKVIALQIVYSYGLKIKNIGLYAD